MLYKSMAEITANRRSIRKFTEESVSRQDIEKIVKIGMQAPSGFNAQPWEVVVVDDSKLRDEIAGHILDGIGEGKTSKGFVNAPVFMMLYGDERTRAYGPAAKIGNDKWWEFVLDASQGSALMSMQLAASSLGLGSMWVSAFRNPEVDKRIRKLLNIPSHLKIYEMLAIGHPGMKPGKKKMRELSDVLHYNSDDNYRTAEDIEKWF